MCVYSVTREPLFIGGPGGVQSPQLHLFHSRQTALHAFQGYNCNSWLRTGLQRVFARSSPFTRGAFYLFFLRRPLHVRRAYVWRVPLTRLGPPRKPSLRRRSDSRHRLSHRKAPKPPIWPLPVQRRCLLNEWGPWSICTFGAEAPQCRTNRGQASTCG
jgi:hypothetical protein